MLAKKDIKKQISQFGDEYFYTLGLNAKFCGGIRRFLSNDSVTENTDNFIVDLLQYWYDNDCDEVGIRVRLLT